MVNSWVESVKKYSKDNGISYSMALVELSRQRKQPVQQEEAPILKKRGRPKKIKKSVTGNKWISHVQQYAKSHNLPYSQALNDPKCKTSYHKT